MRFSLLALIAASLTVLWGQPSPAFEVVSVKPNRTGSAESNLDSRGRRMTATNITVRELLRVAFLVRDFQIAQAPAWIDNERYDIDAKAADDAAVHREDLQPEIRQLLAERFHLAVRRETRQLPVYLLVIGKNGPKLTPHNDGAGSGSRKSCGHLAGTRLTADTIATVLSRQFECDVLNRTGLSGKYDFQLDWTPDSGPCPAADSRTAGLIRPSIFAAIQEQLGLKLEKSTGPVEVLVIDRIEKPSAN